MLQSSPHGAIISALHLLLSTAQPRAHLKGLLQILRELLLAHLLLVRLVEASHVVPAIVIHLQGIAAGVDLHLPVQRLESLGDLLRLFSVRQVLYNCNGVRQRQSV